jgi:CHAD domain-containing protein
MASAGTAARAGAYVTTVTAFEKAVVAGDGYTPANKCPRLSPMKAQPALRPGLAVGEALRTVAGDILAEARAAIEDPAKPDAAAVHDFRRAMKRWRALLRLIQPLIGEVCRDLRHEARDLARELGGARDAQAALDALADLGTDVPTLSARSLVTIRARLETLRQSAETTTLNSTGRAKLSTALDAAQAQMMSWPFDGISFDNVADQLTRFYRSTRGSLPRDWRAAEPEELHELRKHVVNHRYQIEIVAPLWPRYGKMWINEAQKLRDELGSYQDLQVLASLTAPHQLLAPWRSRLTPAIAARQTEHVRISERLATRLFIDKPKGFRRRLGAMWEASD